MKKFISIIIVLILFLPLIESRTVNITKTDFYLEPTQIYRLEDGDGISFLKDNKEYIISVDEIGKTSVRLKSFAYKNNNERETFYVSLNKRFSNKVDFEKDNIYDMKIDLIDIVNNGTKVELLFEALNEPKQENTQESFLKPLINSETKTGLIIAGLIIIIGLLIYFGIKKRKALKPKNR